MSWRRPLYKSVGSKPFFFFAVFGSNFEQMRISEDEHQVTDIPKGLQFMNYSAAEHADYLSGFYTNQIGELLREKGDGVFRSVIRAPSCLVALGTIEDDGTLEYLRNMIGIVQCALEQNAAAVLDAASLRWYTPEEWRETFFEADELEPHNHVAILVTKEADNHFWLHTRGMRKFGRPDLSIRSVPEEAVPLVTALLNRMTELQAAGHLFGTDSSFAWRETEWSLHGTVNHDFDNPDFNNESIEYAYDPNWETA